eukprot:8517425-Pyramimonas_sp.AAC.1
MAQDQHRGLGDARSPATAQARGPSRKVVRSLGRAPGARGQVVGPGPWRGRARTGGGEVHEMAPPQVGPAAVRGRRARAGSRAAPCREAGGGARQGAQQAVAQLGAGR